MKEPVDTWNGSGNRLGIAEAQQQNREVGFFFAQAPVTTKAASCQCCTLFHCGFFLPQLSPTAIHRHARSDEERLLAFSHRIAPRFRRRGVALGQRNKAFSKNDTLLVAIGVMNHSQGSEDPREGSSSSKGYSLTCERGRDIYHLRRPKLHCRVSAANPHLVAAGFKAFQ